MRAASETPSGGRTFRIGEVVRRTALSKELVHHYLRQGLIPRSGERARYSDRQVRLLRQVRTLREHYGLSLDVIRRVFEIFAFNPTPVEALTQTESLGQRMSRFAERGDLISQELFSADALCREVGVEADALKRYREARLVEPIVVDGELRYSRYDARIIALCEQGTELGVPFSSFRTIASHISVAFDLEHAQFFQITDSVSLEAGPERVLADLFVRREIAGAFVENVLNTLNHRQFRRLLDHRGQRAPALTLDAVIYRPSAAFIRRHGLDAAIEQARAEVGQHPEGLERWLHVARLLLHVGREREAVFFLDEAARRFEGAPALLAQSARAQALLGSVEKATALLERHGQATSEPADVAVAWVLIELLRFLRARDDQRPEALLRQATRCRARILAALSGLDDVADARAVEARIFGGYLLSSLPPMFHAEAKGRQLLERALAEANAAACAAPVPGGWQRLQLNAAFLLHQVLRRQQLDAPEGSVDPGRLTLLGALRDQLCRLDPASSFAEQAYVSERDDAGCVQAAHFNQR